jgi:hypothetical protein
MRPGRGFRANDVQHGPFQVPFVDQGQQVFIDHMGATRLVDELRSPRHLRQRSPVQQAHGFWGQRQHARQAVALGQEGGHEVKTPEVARHGMAHILGHLHAHARVFQADDLQLERQAQALQRGYTRGRIEDAAPLRLLVEEGLRQCPHEGLVQTGRRAGLPHAPTGLGHPPLDLRLPRLGCHPRTAKPDAHIRPQPA